MNKADAIKVVSFIEEHYDYVSQEDWFEMCEMLMGMVVDSANKRGWAKELCERFPYMFARA